MEARDVTATINPADYVTDFDKTPITDDPDYRKRQYEEARTLASKPDAVIYISRAASWSASYTDPKNGRVDVYSYERIGYHRDTDAVVQGWKDGGARILDYRPA